MNPFDPTPVLEPNHVETEPMPRGMLVAIKMWKWYLFWLVVPFGLINSIVVPPCMIVWLPTLYVTLGVFSSKVNRFGLLDGYFVLSVGSFFLGVLHLLVTLLFMLGCYQNDTLDAITVGLGSIPNLIGCWLLVAAVLGWRHESDYKLWLARQRQQMSVWEKR